MIFYNILFLFPPATTPSGFLIHGEGLFGSEFQEACWRVNEEIVEGPSQDSSKLSKWKFVLTSQCNEVSFSRLVSILLTSAISVVGFFCWTWEFICSDSVCLAKAQLRKTDLVWWVVEEMGFCWQFSVCSVRSRIWPELRLCFRTTFGPPVFICGIWGTEQAWSVKIKLFKEDESDFFRYVTAWRRIRERI